MNEGRDVWSGGNMAERSAEIRKSMKHGFNRYMGSELFPKKVPPTEIELMEKELEQVQVDIEKERERRRGIIEKDGTSEGAKLGWETRRKGGAPAGKTKSKGEKAVEFIDDAEKETERTLNALQEHQDVKSTFDIFMQNDTMNLLSQSMAAAEAFSDSIGATGAVEVNEARKKVVENWKNAADTSKYIWDSVEFRPGQPVRSRREIPKSTAIMAVRAMGKLAGAIRDYTASLFHEQKRLTASKEGDVKGPFAVDKDGTSEGAKQGWETRRHGGASEEPDEYPPEAERAKQQQTQAARDILDQLGGNKFKVMTGAKNMFVIPGKANMGGLKFSINGKGPKGTVNRVKIEVDPSDTYSVEFGRERGGKYTVVSSHEGIYNDQLQDIFESDTGLYTTLHPRKELEGDTETPFASGSLVGKDGTSEGAKKGWETRRRGGAAKQEVITGEAGRLTQEELDDMPGIKHLPLASGYKVFSSMWHMEGDISSAKKSVEQMKGYGNPAYREEDPGDSIVNVMGDGAIQNFVKRTEKLLSFLEGKIDEDKIKSFKERLEPLSYFAENEWEYDHEDYSGFVDDAEKLYNDMDIHFFGSEGGWGPGEESKSIKKDGTSEGAKKGWVTRKRGGAGAKEEDKPKYTFNPEEELPGLKGLDHDKAIKIEEQMDDVDQTLRHTKKKLDHMNSIGPERGRRLGEEHPYHDVKRGVSEGMKQIDTLLESIKGHSDEGKRQALVNEGKKIRDDYDHYGDEGLEDAFNDLSKLSSRVTALIDGESETKSLSDRLDEVAKRHLGYGVISKDMVEKILKDAGWDKLPISDKARETIEDMIAKGAKPATEFTGKIMIERGFPEEPPAFVRPNTLNVGDRVVPLDWRWIGGHGATIDLPNVPEAKRIKKMYSGPAKVSKNSYPYGRYPKDVSKVETVTEDRLWGIETEDQLGKQDGDDTMSLPVTTRDTTLVLRVPAMASPEGEVNPGESVRD